MSRLTKGRIPVSNKTHQAGTKTHLYVAEMLPELGAAILQKEIQITLGFCLCTGIFSSVVCSSLSKSGG